MTGHALRRDDSGASGRASELDPHHLEDALPQFPDDLPFRPHAPVIWVLGGGGVRGAFQAGALLYIGEHIKDYMPDAICATSVGSFNALVAGERSATGFQKLLSGWLALTGANDMYRLGGWADGVRRLESFCEADLEGLVARTPLIGDGESDFDLDFNIPLPELGYLKTLLFSIGNLWTFGFLGKFESERILQRVEQYVSDIRSVEGILSRTPAVYTLAPLVTRMSAMLDEAALRGIYLRLASVALEDGVRQLVTEDGDLIRLKTGDRRRLTLARPPNWSLTWLEHLPLFGTPAPPLVTGALASASIPVAFGPTLLQTTNGERYASVDGGVRDLLPVHAALDFLQHDWKGPVQLQGPGRILAISNAPPGAVDPIRTLDPTPTPDYMSSSLFKVASRSLDIVTDEVHLNEVALLFEQVPKDFNVTHIYPRTPIGGTLEVDPGLILINLAYGYMAVYDELHRRDLGQRYERACQLADDIAATRRLSWRKERLCEFQSRSQAWEGDVSHPCLKRPFDSVTLRLDDGSELTVRLLPGWYPPTVGNLVTYEPEPIWDGDDLQDIRRYKQLVAGLVADRMNEFGAESIRGDFSYPEIGNNNELSDWWCQFERHAIGTGPEAHAARQTGNLFARRFNPWEAHRLQGGGQSQGLSPPQEPRPC